MTAFISSHRPLVTYLLVIRVVDDFKQQHQVSVEQVFHHIEFRHDLVKGGGDHHAAVYALVILHFQQFRATQCFQGKPEEDTLLLK